VHRVKGSGVVSKYSIEKEPFYEANNNNVAIYFDILRRRQL